MPRKRRAYPYVNTWTRKTSQLEKSIFATGPSGHSSMYITWFFEQFFGTLKRWTGTEWVRSKFAYYDGSNWVMKKLMGWDGISWELVDIANMTANEIFLINDSFETGTWDSWTLVNGTTNIWMIGSNAKFGSSYSAYISSDGSTNTFTKTTASTVVSHFYKDIIIPSNAKFPKLKFDWRCNGENAAGTSTSYDYGTVVITDATITPVADTELSTASATYSLNGRLGANTNQGKFNIGYRYTDATAAFTNNWFSETIDLSGYVGLTKRLVFSWKNNTSTGLDPPMAIDNIQVLYNT